MSEKHLVCGLGFERYHWGIIAIGCREAILDGGYAVAPLPGDPGANKWTSKGIDSQGRPVSVRRVAKNRFEVSRDWSEEEAAGYAVAEEQRLAQAKEREQAEKTVASWPKSAEQFREESSRMFQWGANMMDLVLSDGRAGGYRYDQAVIDRARFLLDELRMLHDTGRIVMDTFLREENTPACLAKRVKAADVARKDRAFQEFMHGVARS